MWQLSQARRFFLELCDDAPAEMLETLSLTEVDMVMASEDPVMEIAGDGRTFGRRVKTRESSSAH